MTLFNFRDMYATKFGVPLTARFKHDAKVVEQYTKEVLHQHKDLSVEEATGRALARLDYQEYRRQQAKGLIVTAKHNYRRKVELAIGAVLVLLVIILGAKLAHGQTTVVRGVAKGTTVANSVTVTPTDANHNALDVNIASGGGSGGTASTFGAAFPATGTAAGFSDGTNMLPATLDASGFLKINCAAGCVAGGSFTDASAFTFGTTSVGNMSAVVDEVATNTVAENSAGAVRMNTNRILYMDISKTAANAIAIKVDGSAVTQPVSGPLTDTQLRASAVPVSLATVPSHAVTNAGTFAVQAAATEADGANVTLGAKADAKSTATDTTAVTAMQVLKQISASVQSPPSQAVTNAGTFVVQAGLPTTVDTNSGVKSASTLRVVLATDQPALTNKLLVTPDSVALPANQSVNVNQVAGTAADVNSGVKSAGTLRVVLATDQPALTNKLLVTPDSVALPANQSVNINQINSVTPLMGTGNTGTGSPRMTLATDQVALTTAGLFSVKIDQTTPGTTNAVRPDTSGATGAAPPARADYVGFLGSGATAGFLTGAAVGDTYKNINVSTATTTLLVTGVSGRQVRISALHMITQAANNVAFIEGTGATCGTGTAGMAGGTTAASGYNLAANGGIAFGSGLGTVMQTATTGDSVCVVTSAATQLSGGLQYTIY